MDTEVIVIYSSSDEENELLLHGKNMVQENANLPTVQKMPQKQLPKKPEGKTARAKISPPAMQGPVTRSAGKRAAKAAAPPILANAPEKASRTKILQPSVPAKARQVRTASNVSETVSVLSKSSASGRASLRASSPLPTTSQHQRAAVNVSKVASVSAKSSSSSQSLLPTMPQHQSAVIDIGNTKLSKGNAVQKHATAYLKENGATSLKEPTVKRPRFTFSHSPLSKSSSFSKADAAIVKRNSGKLQPPSHKANKTPRSPKSPSGKITSADASLVPYHPPAEMPDLQDSEVDENDELYECNCCFNTVYFDYLVQCQEGHLFCCECLQRYTHESVFGTGKATLQCMSDGCTASFPRKCYRCTHCFYFQPGQLIRALPTNLHEKYENRVAEEYLNLAALPNFVKCHYCNAGGELEPNVQFFVCPNPLCQKIVCRFCKKGWDIHKGLQCHKVEETDETQIRVKYEEKMAEAKIRQCSKCKARFTKEDGCNRITCRCGATMCYVCRVSNISYQHFCQHPRSPRKPCKACNSCFLWSNAEEDEKLAIADLKKQANEARATKGFEIEKEIGVPLASRK